jgi:hypothetical protein
VEHAGERQGVSVDTGIAFWWEHRSRNWADEGVRLLKLHGSVDWEWFEPEHRQGHLPHVNVRQVSDDTSYGGSPAVIGGRKKLRAEGPFLSLLAEFESQLSQAQRLLVVGSSFRDAHINEVISRWTTEDDASQLVVVDLVPRTTPSERTSAPTS